MARLIIFGPRIEVGSMSCVSRTEAYGETLPEILDDARRKLAAQGVSDGQLTISGYHNRRDDYEVIFGQQSREYCFADDNAPRCVVSAPFTRHPPDDVQ